MAYEAPKTEALELLAEGVICGSARPGEAGGPDAYNDYEEDF